MAVTLSRTVINTVVNDQRVMREVESRMSLADFLRDELELTGLKLGCEQGACGACTVHLDGDPVRSCIVLAAQADDRAVTTVEGFAPEMHPLQEAFLSRRAFQCGYCTSGMIMQLAPLVDGDRPPSEQEILQTLAGNVCRCTGYRAIVAAVGEALNKRGRHS